jgi:hypothetical protein
MGEPCAAAAARQVWRYLRQFPSPCSPNRSLLKQAARGSPHPSRPTGLWQISRSCGNFLPFAPLPPLINVQKQGDCSTSAKCYRPLDASRASLQILPPPVRLPFWTGFFAGTESDKKRPLAGRTKGGKHARGSIRIFPSSDITGDGADKWPSWRETASFWKSRSSQRSLSAPFPSFAMTRRRAAVGGLAEPYKSRRSGCIRRRRGEWRLAWHKKAPNDAGA